MVMVNLINKTKYNLLKLLFNLINICSDCNLDFKYLKKGLISLYL